MFTGIIEEVGTIERLQRDAYSCKLTIKAKKVLEDVNMGDSIAVNGICLTVTSYSDSYFTADIMNETWKRTSLGKLGRGGLVNLERAMQANGRFGGHIVTGHIDGTGEIRSVTKDSNAIWYKIAASGEILSGIVEKGSITIDGISLTVAKVSERDFSVSIIPHTLEQTILKSKRVNDLVNLENDIVGKYVKKLIGNMNGKNERTITESFLLKNGF